MRYVLFLTFLLSIAGCAFQKTPEPPLPITLKHPWTRQIVRCPYNPQNKSQHKKCAYNLQNKGYVKIEHTSFLPAKYDFPQEGSYPSRRWRENELIPRW